MRRTAWLPAAAAAVFLLPVTTATATPAAGSGRLLPAERTSGPVASRSPAPHSRLVFAAAEEDSTLQGFTSGRVPDPRSYWTVRRNLSMYTPALWHLLQRRRAWLSVNLRWRRDFGPVPKGAPHFGELVAFLRTAARHHVGIVAWLTVPYADGYWLTEDNVATFDRAARDFDAWAHRIGFRPEQVLLDLESPLQDSAISSEALRDPFPAVAMLDRNVDPAHQCAATGEIERLAGWLTRRGYSTSAAAYPFLLDDVADGDLALSDGLDMAVPRPGTFGQVAFMVMRSVYASLIGTDPGSSILASYIDAMRRWYGTAAGFSLGVAGQGPYRNLAAMVEDTRLAAALTPGTIGIYSLETALQAYGRSGIAELFDAAAHPLAGPALTQASGWSTGTDEARTVLAAMNDLVTAGLPLATASRGSPQLANRWPTGC